LRIHHVISSVLEKYGGPSVTVTTLCRELAVLGHEVTLHTYAPAPLLKPEGYALQTYHCARAAPRLGLSVDMARGLWAAARSGDIMHVHALWMLSSVLPAWAVRGTTCQLVASPRGMLDPWALGQHPWPKRLVWATCQGPAVRAAGLVHATAETEIDAVRALGITSPVALIPNGVVMPSVAETAHFAVQPRTLLFLSRLHPKKGVDRLLRAWAQVQAEFPAWELRIVGPDSDGYAANLAALARTVAAQRVTFHGPAFGDARTAHFRTAQLFVLPTHSENFGLVVAEALAHGIPAIVGRGAPWQGLIRENCGYWVDNSVPAIAACLRDTLRRSPAELHELGARGRAWMLRDFSWQERARSMVDAYRWLAGAGPKPPVVSQEHGSTPVVPPRPIKANSEPSTDVKI
jgi:glycosyltransferase involved in cell wall biosynthesis